MVISVPVTAYCGVALEVQPADDGSPRYVLSLAHRDPDLDILLGDTRGSAAASVASLGRLGCRASPRRMAHCVRLRAPAKRSPPPRRRAAAATSLGKRRPRFLIRRKAGDSRRTKVVHGDEREIISYE